MEERLLAKEREDPADFATKLELIELFRAQGRLEEARLARLRLVEVVPVAEEVWLEWLQDEPSVEVCRKALKDFCCKAKTDPQVVLEYLKLAAAQGEDVFAMLMSKVRSSELWDLQRSLTPDLQSKLELYEKQFACPMRGLDKAWAEYSSLTESREVEALYLKTFAEWQRQRPHYEHIQRLIADQTDQGLVSVVEEYVSSAPTQASIIYEEALLGFNSSSELWESYVYFKVKPRQLDAKKTSRAVVRLLLKRAVRNCPAKTVFWQLLMLQTEEAHKPMESEV
jgi:hypothetical protein